MATMKEICNLLLHWHSSGTNSKHDPAFTSFRIKFKNALTAELNKIGATNIVFNYGHYYISGFFTVNTQVYYFSLDDVRSNFHIHGVDGVPLMFRRAKDYKDYRGEVNQWAALETDMFVNVREFSR